MNKTVNKGFFFIAISLAFWVTPILAEDTLSKADAAVANILFEYDEPEKFTSYVISESGFVDITFSSNTPDELYIEILKKLKSHPDIDGVLSGKITLLPLPLDFYSLDGTIKHGVTIGNYPKYLGANVAVAIVTPLLLGVSLIVG